MAFYSPEPAMGQILAQLVESLEGEGREGLSDQLSITWLRYPDSLRQRAASLSPEEFWALPVTGASWRGSHRVDPAQMLQLFLLVAAEAWLQRQLIAEDPELRRALTAMVRGSSHDATGLIVDLLSGTTSGPSLPQERFRPWAHQRQLVSDWLGVLGWPELEGCNICQKTWGEGPYGRERDFFGPCLENGNRLSTDATARMLHAVIAGAIVSPPACSRMRELLLCREPADRAAGPADPMEGFIKAGLSPAARLWGKAGWGSQERHDAAYVETEGLSPFLLVVFCAGKRWAGDDGLLPAIASTILEHCADP